MRPATGGGTWEPSFSREESPAAGAKSPRRPRKESHEVAVLLPGVLLPTIGAAAPALASHSASATFAVSGIQCAACGKALEGALVHAAGVESVNVWVAQREVTVDYDDLRTDPAALAQAVAAAPPAMGPERHYAATLLLGAPNMAGALDAAAIQGSLAAVRGVGQVTADARARSVTVAFAPGSRVRLGRPAGRRCPPGVPALPDAAADAAAAGGHLLLADAARDCRPGLPEAPPAAVSRASNQGL